MLLRATAIVSLMLCSPPQALAFDCSKAKTEVETAICADPALKAVDDALGKAYAGLKAKSALADQKMLMRSQKRWIARREACNQSEDGLTTCVAGETAKRLRLLSGTPDSGPGTGNPPVPVFVVQEGSAGGYELDVQLLRFEKPLAKGERTLNRISAEAKGMLKLGPHGEDTGGAIYGILQDMTMSYASPDLMSVISFNWINTGGAHGNGGVSNFNIDMKTGRLFEIADFFSEGALAVLTSRCKPQLIAEKQKRLAGEPYDPSADDFFKDEIVAEHIATLSRWNFMASKASVSFDAYAIGSYAEGQYDCSFPMDDLRVLALESAPLPHD